MGLCNHDIASPTSNISHLWMGHQFQVLHHRRELAMLFGTRLQFLAESGQSARCTKCEGVSILGTLDFMKLRNFLQIDEDRGLIVAMKWIVLHNSRACVAHNQTMGHS
eukprot:Skav201973  [mRNA]  locus=scaffold103:335458:336454:- [translate_table: standard]